MPLKPKTHEEALLFAEEGFRVHVQHSIQKLLKNKGVSHSQLAQKLGISLEEVEEIFSSDCKLTIRGLARIYFVLEADLKIADES
jgi:transcriptional regulator with XRE-family HTH domain